MARRSTIGLLASSSMSCFVESHHFTKRVTRSSSKKYRKPHTTSQLRTGIRFLQRPKIWSRNCWWRIPNRDSTLLKFLITHGLRIRMLPQIRTNQVFHWRWKSTKKINAADQKLLDLQSWRPTRLFPSVKVRKMLVSSVKCNDVCGFIIFKIYSYKITLKSNNI